MITINDILKLNLEEDIKNVIDLEDISQDEIQSEIESYIITDGLGKYLSTFISRYTGNIKETGVWLSGFYGSGKSYFGKMLGYLIDNPLINGTSARDRFIPRLAGVKNQSLIENDIRKLDAINSRVIFLDVAKQNTDNGLAFTLFSNFLKNLGFRDDLYGYMEYDLYIDGKLDLLKETSKKISGKEWEEIKKSNREVAKAMRRAFLSMDYTDQEYEDTKNTFSYAIQNFDANKFKEELEKYLSVYTDEKLVFIFDEASEAISQKKFNLLDLEGIAESLSSISNKVWTIAIAQEKLDDVINNANVNKSQLTKVTDRFKTKLHLESNEVDVIIQQRLLLKKDAAHTNLLNYYKQHEGLIGSATNLKSVLSTKTNNADDFATYYPFHKYQFDLLQKFLFSSNALVQTQIAARGMIITTFDVLKKEMRNKELYSFTTAHDLCNEAQTAPPADLANKYSTAKKIIVDKGLDIDGELLLKTLHFLNESELVSTTVENITKTYIDDITAYFDTIDNITKALNLLVEAKILLLSNNNYKITSDLEGKLLEEMNDFDVAFYIKKRDLVDYLKNLTYFRQITSISDGSVNYSFNIYTDHDDEILVTKNSGNPRINVYSLFNIDKDDRQEFIEKLKFDTQQNKDIITLIPDNSKFHEIDSLLEEVKRYGYMQEKYNNDDDGNKRQIIKQFSIIKDEKEKDLINLIEQAYTSGSVVYLFDENLLNKDNFKSNINEIQRKQINNIFTKRLSNQLSEVIGLNVIKEQDEKKLHKYFSGDEFKFFDKNGNFTGDHLKIIEEITSKINKRYLDGKSLEDELSMAPWGYSYGSISTALAVLFRAGRLVVKYNDSEFFSHKERAVHDVFNSGTRFKSARFKSLTKTLKAAEKQQIIESLLDLKYNDITEKRLTYSDSDFDVADAITQLADKQITVLNTLMRSQTDFQALFPNVLKQKEVLQQYNAKTTEANYIEKATDFLSSSNKYIAAVKSISKAEKFIQRNLDKIKGYQRFVEAVNIELDKASLHNEIIKENSRSFNEAMRSDVIDKFQDIQNTAQKIRDAYYQLMVENSEKMSSVYSSLLTEIKNAQTNLNDNYPKELNRRNAESLILLQNYSTNKIVDEVSLEYHVQCQKSNFSLSEIVNYIALAPSKATELQVLEASFVKEQPKQELPVKPGETSKPTPPKKLQLTISKKVMTVSEYRHLLAKQLQSIAGMSNDENVEVTLENREG